MRALTASLATPGPAAALLFPTLVALLPLVCWPGLDRPFSLPKLWLIAGLDLLVLAQYLGRKPAPQMPAWPWLAWLGAVSLSAVTGPYVSLEALLFLLLPLVLCAADLSSGAALCAGSAVESIIALLQYSGHDPLQWLGWRPEAFASPRMAVYGTMGNPDFVAAWLCATLPLCAGARGAIQAPLTVLCLSAIFATGSRIFLLALPAAALVSILRNRRLVKWWLLGVPVACALLWFSPVRPLGATIEGRLYLARVTVSHLREIPAAGYGPGSFGLKFGEWQGPWLREHPGDARFAGPVDHAHNDYLEFWVEYGTLGFCAFLVLCGWFAARAWRSRAPDGVLAAFVTLLVIACVDFPFHRPAEWALFAILVSLTLERRSTPSCPSRSSA